MLKDGKVATRIPVQDLQRARTFYAEKLGLEPSEERPGGLLYRCGGNIATMSATHRPTRLSGSTGGKSGPVPCFLSRGTDRNTRGV
jgi:catechol 2,3-dioxygenase-like lactoylglutathione lyase family enzyme